MTEAVRKIDEGERRARLACRHGVVPGRRRADVDAAAEAVVGLHGTDPATIFLSARARVDGLAVADVEDALYARRSLVKHLAMRRTLWVVPRALLPAVQAGASDRVADAQRRGLAREVEKAGLHADGARWLDEAGAAVLAALEGGREATSTELRAEIPLLEGSIAYGEGRSWGGRFPVGPRVLTVLSAQGRIVRASNDGGWAVSRPRWASMGAWLGHDVEPVTAAEGVATLVRRWLAAFGPGTEADLKWWLGSTVTATRRGLGEVGAVEVDVGGRRGWVLADDVGPVEPVEPWAALLPPLDPTTMGWVERDWYLGPYQAQLVDGTGNAGATAWWDGRIVGGWRQTDAGTVELQLLEDVGADGRAGLEREAAELSAWLGGRRVLPRFPSPLSKALATGT